MVEARDRLACHALDRLLGSEHLAPERVVGEDRVREQFVDEVVGRVVAHVDLFEDDVSLRVDVAGPQRSGPDDLGEDVDREIELVVGNSDVERRHLLCREGVHVAADGLDCVRDLGRAALGGALEQQVLEEVAGAELGRLLVSGADADPEADAHRTQGRERLRDRHEDPSRAALYECPALPVRCRPGPSPGLPATASATSPRPPPPPAATTAATAFRPPDIRRAEVAELVFGLALPVLLEGHRFLRSARVPAAFPIGRSIPIAPASAASRSVRLAIA